MVKNIEVELRGILNKNQYNKALALFKEKAKFKENKNRLLIDYSVFLDGEGIRNRQKDIRVRATNNIPEIIIKIGSWGGSESRQELSFKGKEGEFATLVEIFNQLGFSKGIMAERNIVAYEYKRIEFALVQTRSNYFFEAEKMARSKTDFRKVENEIREVCKELKLEVIDKEGFFKFVEKLNKEDNEIFEFKNYKKNYFKGKFGLK